LKKCHVDGHVIYFVENIEKFLKISLFSFIQDLVKGDIFWRQFVSMCFLCWFFDWKTF